MTNAKPTIYLNMIIGDFEPVETVEQSLNSVLPHVDGAYITVTYKTKKPTASLPLIKLLKKHNVHISYFQWCNDFSKARQYALDIIPKGQNVFIYWQDADDILENGEEFSNILKTMVKDDITGVYFEYLYSVEINPDTNEIDEVLVTHKRERIIKHDGNWSWRGALHETLIEDREYGGKKIYIDTCKVIHLSNVEDIDANIDRNLEVLEQAIVDEKGKDPRTRIHLARVYYDKGKQFTDDTKKRDEYFNKSIKWFYLYLEGKGQIGDPDYLEPSGFRQERATAYSMVAEIAMLQGQYETAVQVYDHAIDEGFEFPDYYISKALCYTLLDEWARAETWLKLGLALDGPKTTMMTTPKLLKTRTLQVSANIAINKREFDKAQKMLEELLVIDPKDELAQEKLKRVKEVSIFNKACQSIAFLGKYLETLNAQTELEHLVQAIPKEMQQERFATEMRHLFMPSRTWNSNEIAILCGPGVGEWSPDSINDGIGGSEEAVIYLSRELTNAGWKVTVYGNPGDSAGDFDGVKYLPWYDFNTKDNFNSVILWRNIGAVDLDFNARFTMVWLHDVPMNADFTEERVSKVDKIAVLSEYHKNILQMQKKDGSFVDMPDEKVFITTNGIPDLHVNQWNGDSKKMIFMSSPDRGIQYLLKNWDKIKEKVPDAKLDVYYGFDTYDKLHKDNPGAMMWKDKIMGMMKQDGITYYGKVGHKQLHEAIAKCGVWAYPTDFTETSCISAIKAQALGAIPVTVTLGALDETVKNGYKLDADIRTKQAQEEYVDLLAKVLNDEKEQAEIREKMMPWARDQYHWSTVAKQWNTLMKVSIQNPQTKVIEEVK